MQPLAFLLSAALFIPALSAGERPHFKHTGCPKCGGEPTAATPGPVTVPAFIAARSVPQIYRAPATTSVAVQTRQPWMRR